MVIVIFFRLEKDVQIQMSKRFPSLFSPKLCFPPFFPIVEKYRIRITSCLFALNNISGVCGPIYLNLIRLDIAGRPPRGRGSSSPKTCGNAISSKRWEISGWAIWAECISTIGHVTRYMPDWALVHRKGVVLIQRMVFLQLFYCACNWIHGEVT